VTMPPDTTVLRDAKLLAGMGQAVCSSCSARRVATVSARTSCLIRLCGTAVNPRLKIRSSTIEAMARAV